jgi:hypothetical protein
VPEAVRSIDWLGVGIIARANDGWRRLLQLSVARGSAAPTQRRFASKCSVDDGSDCANSEKNAGLEPGRRPGQQEEQGKNDRDQRVVADCSTDALRSRRGLIGSHEFDA